MLKSKVIKRALGIIFSVLVTVAMVSVATVHAFEKQDRKIVVFNNSVNKAKKNALLKKHGAQKIKELQSINGVVVKLSKENKLKDEKEIAYIEDDFIISISKKPVKDPVETPPPIPEVIPWGIEWMGAPDYWEQTDTDNVKVAIIDTGIDLDHSDLKDNIKGGFNVLKKKKPADDDNGHGTHVAGIIAAVDNDIGVIGMVPDADLYAVKVLDSSGNGYISDVVEGIDWAIKNGIDIMNMSFGTVNDSQSMHDIVIKAHNAGIIMVAAAGNNYGGTSEYPAAYSEVVSVGAIDMNGDVASFSALDGVDVFAPGVDIYSTLRNSVYDEMDGTSMAAPHEVGKRILLNMQEY